MDFHMRSGFQPKDADPGVKIQRVAWSAKYMWRAGAGEF